MLGHVLDGQFDLCTLQRVFVLYVYTELEITVRHRTFSVHIAQMSEHSTICVKLCMQ